MTISSVIQTFVYNWADIGPTRLVRQFRLLRIELLHQQCPLPQEFKIRGEIEAPLQSGGADHRDIKPWIVGFARFKADEEETGGDWHGSVSAGQIAMAVVVRPPDLLFPGDRTTLVHKAAVWPVHPDCDPEMC